MLFKIQENICEAACTGSEKHPQNIHTQGVTEIDRQIQRVCRRHENVLRGRKSKK